MSAAGPPSSQQWLDATAAELAPLPLGPDRTLILGLRLMNRVRRSAAAQADLVTWRREDGDWLPDAPGLRRRLLRCDSGVRIELIQLDPHAHLPTPGNSLAQELLVVDGALVLQSPRLLHGVGVLGRHAHHVRGSGEVDGLQALDAGALLYVRHRLLPLDALDTGEASWWLQAQAASVPGGGGAAAWGGLCAGVAAASLFSQGDVVSGLVRVAPGAAMPDHRHAIDEDCLMLAGELFFGDILVRAGDYQKATAGGQHVDCHSERGAEFYFHGVLPRDIVIAPVK